MDWNAISGVAAQWPTDWILIGAFAAFAALDAIRSGPARATAVALSLPVTLLITDALSQAFFLGPLLKQFATPVGQLIIFVLVFVALYIATHRIISTFSEGGRHFQALIAGIAAAIVVVVIWLEVPALQSLWHFGAQVHGVFAEAYRFWWLIAAYFGLAFTRR